MRSLTIIGSSFSSKIYTVTPNKYFVFIFAHIFAGTLLGLGFQHLTNDRRAIPLCIFGSMIPDISDKTLGLLIPATLGSGRTIAHTLLIVLIFLLLSLIFLRSRTHRLLLVGFSCSILLHQICDEMWTIPSNWFYPLFGPFQGCMIPDYIGHYFWLEIGNPSEWIFMLGTAILLIEAYYPRTKYHNSTHLMMRVLESQSIIVLLLGCMGIYLIISGFIGITDTVIAPVYNFTYTIMAGLLSLVGTIVLIKRKSVILNESDKFLT